MTQLLPPDGPVPTDSPFGGHTVAFTGKLSSLGRKEAQALVERLGGIAADQVTSRTTMLVIGAEGFKTGDAASSHAGGDDAEKSNKLKRTKDANARSPGSVQILSEEDFCKLGGLPTAERLRQQLYRLRDLEKWGLIHSVVRTNADTYYCFRDLLVIKQASAALERGTPLRALLRSLVMAREGQLTLDFRPAKREAQPAKVIALTRRRAANSSAPEPARVWPVVTDAESALAARYFCEGTELDEGDESQQQEAAVAYRKALVLDPNLVPALVNLANIHYARDELIEAQALYERAMSVETECFEACFNLGNICHDLGRYDRAVACYRDALDLNPTLRGRALLHSRDTREARPVHGGQAPLARLPAARPQRRVGQSRSGTERVARCGF